MTPEPAPDAHPPVARGRIGVLLINLGTPDAPDAAAVRRYLAEFLSDPRVIEIPRIAWKPILHGIILRTRPRKSAHAYRQVWTEEGSPLAAITRRQAEALQQRLGDEVIVDYAMRYGRPAIAAAVARMVEAGCDADPRRAALPAILRGDDGDRAGCAVRGAGADAAGSRRCERCRPITTIRCTSAR